MYKISFKHKTRISRRFVLIIWSRLQYQLTGIITRHIKITQNRSCSWRQNLRCNHQLMNAQREKHYCNMIVAIIISVIIGVFISHLLRMNVAHVKMGWLNKDSVNGTTEVCGSVSQYHAPIDVIIDIIVKTTVEKRINTKLQLPIYTHLLRHRSVEGFRHAMTSVNRRSNAFRSVNINEKLLYGQ